MEYLLISKNKLKDKFCFVGPFCVLLGNSSGIPIVMNKSCDHRQEIEKVLLRQLIEKDENINS